MLLCSWFLLRKDADVKARRERCLILCLKKIIINPLCCCLMIMREYSNGPEGELCWLGCHFFSECIRFKFFFFFFSSFINGVISMEYRIQERYLSSSLFYYPSGRFLFPGGAILSFPFMIIPGRKQISTTSWVMFFCSHFAVWNLISKCVLEGARRSYGDAQIHFFLPQQQNTCWL